MNKEVWAHTAVRHLEALAVERAALAEGRASAADGHSERRVCSIDDEIETLYAQLNAQAQEFCDAEVPALVLEKEPALGRSGRSAREDEDEAAHDMANERELDRAEYAPAGARFAIAASSECLTDAERDGGSAFDAGSTQIDTVVVQYPADVALNLDSESGNELDLPSAGSSEPGPALSPLREGEGPDAWFEDERLELRGEFEALLESKAEKSEAFAQATKRLEGQAEEFDRIRSQAQAAKEALEHFEQARAEMQAQIELARQQLKEQQEQEKRARVALVAMEARLRAESKLLGDLDVIRAKIKNVQGVLESTVASAEQEKAALAQSVEDALVAAERATRQAEEMRDAAERAHQRAEQAIAHAQEVETRSDVREQELGRVIDGLECQISGLSHEESGVMQQLEELRGAPPSECHGDMPRGGLSLVVDSGFESDVHAASLDDSN